MQIVEVTKDNFEQEVLGAKVPVVIDLGAGLSRLLGLVNLSNT